MTFPRRLIWKILAILALEILGISAILFIAAPDGFILIQKRNSRNVEVPQARVYNNGYTAIKANAEKLPSNNPLRYPQPKIMTDKRGRLDKMISDTLAANETKQYEIDFVEPQGVAIQCETENDLQLALIDPRGKRYDSLTMRGNPRYTYSNARIFDNLTIMILALEEPVPEGKWTLEVTNKGSKAQRATFDLQALSIMPIGILDVQTDKKRYQRGDTIEIRASLIDLSKLVKGADLIATVRRVSPGVQVDGDIIDTLRLFDDGTHGDNTPQNGLYTNIFTKTEKGGEFSISVSARKNVPDTINRTQTILATVSRNRAKLYNGCIGYGQDVNADGIFDKYLISVWINVVDSGQYSLSGDVYYADSINTNPIAYAQIDTFLKTGDHEIAFVLDGKKLFSHYSGWLKICNILVNARDSLGVEKVNSMDYCYSTPPCKELDFVNTGIIFTGNFRSDGLDIDGDGLYDSLIVDFETSIGAGGYYNWHCTLLNLNGTIIGIDYGAETLKRGKQWLRLAFAGHDINKSRKDGPYIFMNFEVKSLKNRDCGNYYRKVYSQKYRYADFE